jgi:hypothetical protein
MPLLGNKPWLIITGGGTSEETGGVLSEIFGPTERLSEQELKACIIVADAVRNGNGAMIDANGEALDIDSTNLEAHWTLEEVLKNDTGVMTPIEAFISRMLGLYRAKHLDAEFILEEAKDLQEQVLAMDRDLVIVAKRYRRQLDEAIALADSEEEAQRKPAASQTQPSNAKEKSA